MMGRSHARFAWHAAWLFVGANLLAPTESLAQPVVQPLPGPEAARLNEAMRALAQDPQSVPALIAAAEASLKLDDADAALTFFRRAEALVPQNGQVKAGLATVMVRQQQPVEALRLFAEAEQLGEPMAAHAAERGLAHDLVGDNARAQADYALALQQRADPVIIRRLALSQAISGNGAAAEATLLPLLQRNDLAAYRTRAFVLAILGKPEEAVTIAQTMLPERLSGRLAPYLRFMPRLTRPQQAAAANLGTFPSAADIGRQDPALAAYAAPAPAAQPVRTADSRLVPSGPPMGQARPSPAETAAAVAQPQAPVRVAAATPAPLASAIVRTSPGLSPARIEVPPSTAAVTAQPASIPEPSAQPAAAVLADPAASSPALDTPPQPIQVALQEPSPERDAADEARGSLQAAEVAGVEPPLSAPPRPSLSDAFAEFQRAGPVPATAQPAAGSVDVTAIEPRREPSPAVARAAATAGDASTKAASAAAAAATKASAPARPAAPPKTPPVASRHWVQVATGRDTKALAFDWRRLKREAGGLLDKPAPHVAAWGQTNRLVAGPFPTAAAADEMVGKLKDKDIEAFRFTSAVGEDVKPLD